MADQLFVSCLLNRSFRHSSGPPWESFLAYGAVVAIKVILPGHFFARGASIGIKLPVLFFSVGVAIFTGILCWAVAGHATFETGPEKRAPVRHAQNCGEACGATGCITH